MRDRYDVVIVGGGVSGSSTAYFLAAEPAFAGSVLVVERDPSYQHCPSARATGGIRQQFSTPENIDVGLFGAHFVKHVGDYLAVDGEVPDVGWREGGYLLLATPPMLEPMRRNHAVQRARGADIALLAPAELAERFPWLATEGLAGGFLGLRDEGWVDPYSLLQAFRRKARHLGVEYVHDEALGLAGDGRRVRAVRLRDAGEVRAGIVVNAAGASGAARLARDVGVTLPLESRKRCTFVIECRHLEAATPLTILPEGVAFRPEGRTFLCNVSPPAERDPESFEHEIDHALFEGTIWPVLARRVPAFEAVKVAGAWCCHYDFNTFDENALIGRLPGLENAYVMAGFSGHGLQQSPAMGRAMCELVVHGGYRSIDLGRLRPERVREGAPVVESNCY